MNTSLTATRLQIDNFNGSVLRNVTATLFFLLSVGVRGLRWLTKTTLKIIAYFVGLAVVMIIAAVLAIAINAYRTDYNVLKVSDSYQHSKDQMTTDIIDWLAGHGPVPEHLKLPLYRQYVKTIRENAKMENPSDFPSLGYQELNTLVIEWYDDKFQDRSGTREEKIAVINNLFEEAVRPPLEGFEPNVYERVWMVMSDVGAPRVRLIAEQDEYPSRIMAASAPGGDDQPFYYPPEDTIYIRYNDSVKVLLREVAHAKQFNDSPFSSYWRLAGSLGSSFLKGAVREANEIYQQGYRDPTNIEGEAHGPGTDDILAQHGLSIVYEQAPDMLAPEHVCVVQNPLNINN